MHFDTWYTFSLQKWITALCSSLVQMKLEVSMFMAKKKLMTEMDYQGHTCTTMVGEKLTICILLCPTSSIANCKTCTYIADNFWLTYICSKQMSIKQIRFPMDFEVSRKYMQRADQCVRNWTETAVGVPVTIGVLSAKLDVKTF